MSGTAATSPSCCPRCCEPSPRATAPPICDGTFGGGGYAGGDPAPPPAAPCSPSTATPTPSPAAPPWPPASPAGCTCWKAASATCCRLLAGQGVTALDGVVLDLGVSSFQLDQPERGFSFRSNGPLDMRMEKAGNSARRSRELTAGSRNWPTCSSIWARSGTRGASPAPSSPRAREAPIATTGRLAEIVRAAAPRDPSGLDRATRSFQALRIAVNDELGEVERGLARRRAAAGAGRAAGGGRLPLARGPDREALHGRRPPARGAGASRHDPASLRRRAERVRRAGPGSACSRRGRSAPARRRPKPIPARAAPGCAPSNASPRRTPPHDPPAHPVCHRRGRRRRAARLQHQARGLAAGPRAARPSRAASRRRRARTQAPAGRMGLG